MAVFFHMGGYALYVWGSYGVMAVLLVAELVLLSRRNKSLVARLRSLREMEKDAE
ncbi:MAG: heme exporter protein CcmD [Nitrospirota bacterium]|nr:heme exporter protein CcmD [Nitrospirota bacterium]